MKSDLNQPIQREYAAKLGLIATFIILLIAFVLWMSARPQGLEIFRLSALDLVLLGFATLRLGRLIAYDLITEPLRQPFARTVPDETGAGDTVEARGSGVQRAVGQMISCPVCAGTWVAALLVAGLVALPGPTRIFLAITAAIGAAEVLNSLVEALCWTGQANRTLAGLRGIEREKLLAADERRTESSEQAAEEKKSNGKFNPPE